jgi:hypothetical protein
MATLASFKGPNSVSGGIGWAGISRAKASGLTDEQIKQMAAAEGLKISTPSGPNPNNTSNYGILAGFRGPNAGPGGIGLAGIERARAAGLTDLQIQQMAKQEGLGFGPLAQISLAYPSPTAPTYSLPGNNESVDGNALGFRRKKSSAKMSGLTSKGTGQFRITGQSGQSSGLNIGI